MNFIEKFGLLVFIMGNAGLIVGKSPLLALGCACVGAFIFLTGDFCCGKDPGSEK
jgi:hypothetical protein